MSTATDTQSAPQNKLAKDLLRLSKIPNDHRCSIDLFLSVASQLAEHNQEPDSDELKWRMAKHIMENLLDND